MSNLVVSDHGPANAAWYQLNTGQQYRLKLRVWELHEEVDAVCGGSVALSLGEFQQQFDSAGGLVKAVAGVALRVAETRWCDIHVTPHSQHNMLLELRLQALNGSFLGETFTRTISKDTSATFNIMLAYAEED